MNSSRIRIALLLKYQPGPFLFRICCAYLYSFICISDYLPSFRYLFLFLHIAFNLFTLSHGCLMLKFPIAFPGSLPLSLQGTALPTSYIRTTFYFAYSLRLTFHNLSHRFLLLFNFFTQGSRCCISRLLAECKNHYHFPRSIIYLYCSLLYCARLCLVCDILLCQVSLNLENRKRHK